MSPVRSRNIVVDTTVVCSAGRTAHPVSRACREALEAIKQICHHVVLTPEIREEWREHQGRYFSDWIVSMYSRKKVARLDSVKSRELRRAIDRSSMSPTDQEIVEKDALIINAALASDRIIVTQDGELTRAMARYPRLESISVRITWINPESDDTSKLESI